MPIRTLQTKGRVQLLHVPQGDGHALIVAQQGTKRVGRLILNRVGADPDDGHSLWHGDLHVTPSHRSRGVGTDLLLLGLSMLPDAAEFIGGALAHKHHPHGEAQHRLWLAVQRVLGEVATVLDGVTLDLKVFSVSVRVRIHRPPPPPEPLPEPEPEVPEDVPDEDVLTVSAEAAEPEPAEPEAAMNVELVDESE